MPGREGPTNERIVTLLRQILEEMKDIKVRQQRLEKELAKVTKAPR